MAGRKRINGVIKPNSSFKPEYVNRAALAYQVGLTDQEFADLLGVTRLTILNWSTRYPEFADAMRNGKALADERVERALYSRAVGYSFESEEIFLRSKPARTVRKNGKKKKVGGGTEVIRVKTMKHVPPDVTAQIFWLKNRRRDQWRDVQKHEHGTAGAFDKLTPEQLEASILEDLKKLGISPTKLIEGAASEEVVAQGIEVAAGVAPAVPKAKSAK